MTEPFQNWRCPICRNWVKTYGPCSTCSPPRNCEMLLASHYEELRGNCASLEALIASAELDPQSLKRLDKAVTVMKVAFKIVKKVLRTNGVETKKRVIEASQGSPT